MSDYPELNFYSLAVSRSLIGDKIDDSDEKLNGEHYFHLSECSYG